MSRFEGKTAIVTGAGAGIGRAVVAKLTEEGATVVACDLREERLADYADRDRVLPVAADTADPATAERLVAAALERGGSLDVVVNNAAIFITRPAEDYTDEDWRRNMAVNLDGYFYLARAAGRRMIEAGGGAIVNVASPAGMNGIPENIAYVASKHGVVGLTRALAIEWARYGIRVNAVSPGFTETEATKEFEAQNPGMLKGRKARVLADRPGRTEEQANVIAFLAGDEASYVSGLIANVDHGSLALYSGYAVPRRPE
jgi:NAD(P)-dependent dehydrogenase (short-subunit alcohol dehydrogenase family)